MLAEYDGHHQDGSGRSNLLRKYIYGPGIDQPVSMIEVDHNNAAYYYHFDALGSVVALSDSTGDTVQTYEYSVYGEVSASDPNHPNPYMFAARRYDIEIGLHHNRARYYNPYTGRFLQTDPVGYNTGMNLYCHCGNGPLNRTDPSGLREIYVDIPMESVPQYDNGATAQALVESFLFDVGFYKEYSDWIVMDVDIVDGNFHVKLFIEDEKWQYKDPNFGVTDVGGVKVVTIDGIGRLDSRDWTLERIISASVQNVNDWPSLGPLNIMNLVTDCDTPFF